MMLVFRLAQNSSKPMLKNALFGSASPTLPYPISYIIQTTVERSSAETLQPSHHNSNTALKPRKTQMRQIAHRMITGICDINKLLTTYIIYSKIEYGIIGAAVYHCYTHQSSVLLTGYKPVCYVWLYTSIPVILTSRMFCYITNQLNAINCKVVCVLRCSPFGNFEI